MTKDDIVERRLQERFDAAKRTSDFIGMLTRLAFLSLMISYLLNSAPSQTKFLEITYFISAIFLFALSCILGIRMARLFDIYELAVAERWLSLTKNNFVQLLFLFARKAVYLFFPIVLFGVIYGIGKYGETLADRLDAEQHRSQSEN